MIICSVRVYYWFHVNSGKIRSSCSLKIGCLMWLLRLGWNEQTGVSGRALCLLCSSMCGAPPARGSVESLWTDSDSRRVSTLSSRSQETNLCARPFLAAVFMDVFGEIFVAEWKFIFLCRVHLLNKWKCTDECYLCLLAPHSFFPSTLLPLHRAVDDVQIVSMLKCHHMAQRESLSLENLVCNVCFI